ncbi:NAD-dependent protein deacetylase [Caballeronia sp. SBC1]|nr:NAD-dependent protein deacetylase [Caballeronia sp. SBC1]
MTYSQDEKLEKAAGWLREAGGLLITAGAGMGVDSGLPDFRGWEGFWRAYPALHHHGLSFEDIANPARFAEHPELAWGFYGHRLKLYRETVPHEGFAILRRWADRMPVALSYSRATWTDSSKRPDFPKAGSTNAMGRFIHFNA